MIPECYTVRELSNKIKIHPYQIRKWVDMGILPILALPTTGKGRRVIRITDEAFKIFLESNKKEIQNAKKGKGEPRGSGYFTV